MPRARKHLVCLSETPYYHVVSRCVRRAFLCGRDRFSGKSYEHRRGWVEDRIRILSSLFRIDVCAYAVMSNHYHLVVRLRAADTATWSDDEVLKRWTALFRGPLLVQRYRGGESLSAVELDTVRASASVYRARLHSLSWFMKCLNEPIARKANAEDGCTGHFWEARFYSQPLRSARALVSAMAYVDLNPVRAGIATTPAESRYTSIRARIQETEKNLLSGAVARLLKSGELNHFQVPVRPLLAFDVRVRGDDRLTATHDSLPMIERDYRQLVDVTARIVVRGKRSGIDSRHLSTLNRLQLSVDEWLQASTSFHRVYRQGDLPLKSLT